MYLIIKQQEKSEQIPILYNLAPVIVIAQS
jgi:hypothetical protein